MTREEFEQLLSAALDAPRDADLAARIAAAREQLPGADALMTAWRRLGELAVQQRRAALPVRWESLAQRISARVDEAAAAMPQSPGSSIDRLDAAFSQLSGSALPVDWARLGQRISDQVDRVSSRSPGRGAARFGRAMWLGLAAAAALGTVVFLRPGLESSLPQGPAVVVRLVHSPPPAPQSGTVSVRILTAAHPAAPGVSGESEPEALFLLDPLSRGAGGDQG